nr:uncharacterized protein LOC109174707 [Ipomoea batatas]
MLDDGEEDSVFTIKLHLGGDMIFKPRFSYKNGLVEYFNHFNCDEGSILDLRRMVKQLRFCDKKAQFWYQYGNPRRPKLMKLSSDADILGLITDIPVNKKLDIYVEHLYDDQWDYDVEISMELGDDTLLHDDVFSEDESRGSDSVGEQDYEKNNLRDTATSSKPKGGLEEQAEDFVEVECNLSEQILRSLCDSDSEGAAQGPLNVFEERNLKKEGFKFEIGMVFSSAKEFKWAIQYHEAMRQKDVMFKKNEHRRARAICRHNQICQWTIFGSSSNQNSPFTVKTYNPVHICGNQDENKVVTSGFFAKVFKDDFRVNKEWGRGAFKEHVRSKFNCQLTRNQAYLAKKKALKKIDGLDSEQFLLLNDYCEELRRSNPGSTVKMKLDSEFTVNGRPRFERLYICFAGCKEGFVRGCRPIIGLDGCHLKGTQKGGQLLSAIGLDADNSMFPVAFAVVEGELRDTWSWFLKLLDNDLNLSNNPGAWTIISNKQKGLIPAVEELFPGLEHRFCARHLHSNFVKDGFTGHILKMHFWNVCKATTEAEFEARMEELKGCNVKAFDWLKERDPKHYCRAFFSTFPKSDLLLNNLCESWNSCILNFRDKPIQTMCEKLRLYLMTRMQRNRDRMMSYPFKVCPRILKLIEEGKEKSARFTAYKSVDEIYQVDDDNFKAYKVDLSSRQCSCKRWDLSGIPCTHAIAAIRKKGDLPENHVHACYSVENYLRAYGPAILPIRAQELWHKTGMPSPLPPKYNRTTCKATKKGEVKKCKLCGMRGHNRTTCKGKSQQVNLNIYVLAISSPDVLLNLLLLYLFHLGTTTTFPSCTRTRFPCA